MGRILAISSHVARGGVGLSATVPALQALGHEVWALPTILLSSRPGLGTLVKRATSSSDLAAMLAGLEADGCWDALDAVFAGYFPSPDSVTVAAQAIGRIRKAKPGVVVLVDPVIGDDGRLYVATEIAEAIRSELLPQATVATPNVFELGWLTGQGDLGSGGVAVAARSLHLPNVVVTSAATTGSRVSTLMVTADTAIEQVMPRRPAIPNGAGDLFAGLFLGHLLNGKSAELALGESLGALDTVLKASENQAVLQLSALAARQ